MVDVLTPSQRARNMAAILGKDTKPEMVVRRLIHGLGYRYVLHDRKLPGTPDLVFPSRRKVVFVHGCYWHLHNCRYGRVIPKTNAGFWAEKRGRNVARDKRNARALKELGWELLVIWECKTRFPLKLVPRIRRFLDGKRSTKRSQ